MDRIEKKILDIIDQNAEKIIAFGDDIWHHAELGFAEFRTSQKFAEHLESLGLSCERELAVTGVKSYLKEKKDGEVRVALMGEMDALPIADHEDSNPKTGAAHCCGHDAQLTGVMGASFALADPEVQAALGGNVVFFGVPSEEGSTLKIKEPLMAAGKIHSGGGKCEFIRNGVMDDIDITVGHHIHGADYAEQTWTSGNAPSMGFIEKYATYTGVRQHPAFSFKAIDTLSAATLAMHAVDQQREAFNLFHKWNTHLVHGYIVKGGDAANIVSDNVLLDYNMRAKTIDAMQDLAFRIDRCMRAGAEAVGAGLEIKTAPGYLPVVPIKDGSIIYDVFNVIDPNHAVHHRKITELTGTTDYGDLSTIMPVIQFLTDGCSGTAHTTSFHRDDLNEYYVVPAKAFAIMAYRLLKDDAAEAKKILAENKPLMTKEGYLKLIDELSKVEKIDMVPVPEKFI